jgi:AcrR family transcriptional regulator
MRLAAQDRREQLIGAATRLFAEQGFDATSTRAIAEQAGVNEALIFRYFSSKEELYAEVVANRVRMADQLREVGSSLAADPGSGPREVLAEIAGRLLDRSRDDATLTRLLLYSALRNDDFSERFFRTYVADVHELLSDYIRRGIEQGLFRAADPAVVARGFLGSIVCHYLVQELFGGEQRQQFDPYLLGGQLADLWLNGISIHGAELGAPARAGVLAEPAQS